MNIGTLFSHGGDRFRVTSFLKVESYAVTGDDWFTEILREILVEEGKDPDNLHRLVYCTPEEATVVFGSGVCGCVVPITGVVAEGQTNCDETVLAGERLRAANRIGKVADVGDETLARLVAALGG